jgi:hypothetical protein
MNARLKPYAWIGIVVSVLAGLYSFMGLAATASLSVASGSDCHRRAAIWTAAIAVSVLVLTMCVVGLVRSRRVS